MATLIRLALCHIGCSTGACGGCMVGRLLLRGFDGRVPWQPATMKEVGLLGVPSRGGVQQGLLHRCGLPCRTVQRLDDIAHGRDRRARAWLCSHQTTAAAFPTSTRCRRGSALLCRAARALAATPTLFVVRTLFNCFRRPLSFGDQDGRMVPSYKRSMT